MLKYKDFKKNAAPLCLGNVSKYISVDNLKKIGLYEYVYNFSVDYDSFGVDEFLDIHKNLAVKNNIK